MDEKDKRQNEMDKTGHLLNKAGAKKGSTLFDSKLHTYCFIENRVRVGESDSDFSGGPNPNDHLFARVIQSVQQLKYLRKL